MTIYETEIRNNINKGGQIDWDYISTPQKFSEEFMREFQDKLNWDNISKYQVLSENFIEKSHKMVNWEIISEYQKLSESFISKYFNKVNWKKICEYQLHLFILSPLNRTKVNCLASTTG